ncbi:MAG: type II CRISPR-associated endonuclease Cas1 [Erysipelotrichaceae bacterium]
MSWRTIVVSNQAKLSYRNGHLIIRNEVVTMIHLSEINTIIVESTAVSLTAYLLSELMKEKIKIIFCDEKRNPQGEIVSYYGSHNSSKRINQQIEWDNEIKEFVWTKIIYQKISNQCDHMKKLDLNGWKKLRIYLSELQIGDVTNREGHAAKVYFNALFGKSFCRDDLNEINAALDYGYTILLSCFNREIVACGYLTQLGMQHRNEFNPFNLSSDIMEPYRVLIDEIVFQKKEDIFNSKFKLELINILNYKVVIDGKEQYLTNAIGIYVRSVFTAIELQDSNVLKFFDYA